MIIPGGSEAYSKKVSSAARALLTRLPFFGYLLLGASVQVKVSKIKTMGTNEKDIFCSEQFILEQPTEILVFAFLHEVLHVYMSHFSRRGSRDPKTWNVAIDMWTNKMCSELLAYNGENASIPAFVIQPEPWIDGLTVEQIYEELMSKAPPAPEPEDSEAGELSNGTDLFDADPDTGEVFGQSADTTWQESFRQDIANANALTANTDITLPGELVSRMQKLLNPKAPWNTMLRGGLCRDLGWDLLSYVPPKMNRYPMIIPQAYKKKERTLVLGVDVSGSIPDHLIQQYITEAIAAAEHATRTVVVVFDAIVREVYETRFPRDIQKNVKFLSGPHSHTSVVGLFEEAKKQGASSVAILTDGYVKLPDTPFPNTHWVLPTNGKALPWGRNYYIQHPWL